MIFGITGGSGAGKSTVSEIFRSLGVYVADADKAAREVVMPGMPCLGELTAALGEEILEKDGRMNRVAVAELVFSDKNKLRVLNDISHRYINEYVLDEIRRSGADIAAVDGAVIIGSPVEKNCEFIVSVTADRSVRAARITERDNITEEAALRRIDAQPAEEFYREHSKYIIRNDGSAEELERAVKEVFEKIKEYLI